MSEHQKEMVYNDLLNEGISSAAYTIMALVQTKVFDNVLKLWKNTSQKQNNTMLNRTLTELNPFNNENDLFVLVKKHWQKSSLELEYKHHFILLKNSMNP